MKLKVPPLPMVPELNELEVIVCPTASLFVQVTVVPFATASADGLNAKPLISTDATGAVPGAGGGGAGGGELLPDGGHAANSQFGPVLPTGVPSGHIFASIEQATGPVGLLLPGGAGGEAAGCWFEPAGGCCPFADGGGLE